MNTVTSADTAATTVVALAVALAVAVAEEVEAFMVDCCLFFSIVISLVCYCRYTLLCVCVCLCLVVFIVSFLSVNKLTLNQFQYSILFVEI